MTCICFYRIVYKNIDMSDHMQTSPGKSRIKKISLVLLLVSIVQWSHGGFIICFGADGHVGFEQPVAKDCCKKNAPIVSLDVSIYVDVDHCIDIPIWARKNTFSINNNTVPVQKDALPWYAASQMSCFANRVLRALHSQATSPPHNPLLATLKNVVLLV